MRLEQVEQRVLGAIRFVDATTKLKIRAPLSVEAAGLKFVRNLSGHYVIANALGLEAHVAAFENPPASPALGNLAFEVSVADPSHKYLPRRHALKLPRDPDPQHHAAADSLFQFISVELFPSSIAQTGPGWAVIRATVLKLGTREPLKGSLIRVTRKNGTAGDEKPLGRGLTDQRGEALVAVPGIPVTTFGEGAGAVTTNEIDVTIAAFVDPNASGIPDPDDLEARRATLKTAATDAKLASGRMLPLTLEVPIP
ncbi:MAG TPA: hypothetical protein VEW46_26450 [Pyrinomonadaceae bacterium]|nr:hypothetical protein [Pyrinomonadaceae bacterium]